MIINLGAEVSPGNTEGSAPLLRPKEFLGIYKVTANKISAERLKAN